MSFCRKGRKLSYRFQIVLMLTLPRNHVSRDCPGKADIDVGFRHNDNDRFILHDSEGFEPWEDAKLNTVMDFIEERIKRPDLSERLHAIWWVPYHMPRTTRCKVYALLGFVSQYRSPVIMSQKLEWSKSSKWYMGEVNSTL